MYEHETRTCSCVYRFFSTPLTHSYMSHVSARQFTYSEVSQQRQNRLLYRLLYKQTPLMPFSCERERDIELESVQFSEDEDETGQE